MKPIRIFFFDQLIVVCTLEFSLIRLGRNVGGKFVLSDPRVEFRGLASFGSLTTLEWDRDVGRDEQGKLNFCTLDFSGNEVPRTKD